MLMILTRRIDEKETGNKAPDHFGWLVLGELFFFDLPIITVLVLMLGSLFHG